MQQARLGTAPGGVEHGTGSPGRCVLTAALALLALLAMPGPAAAKYGSPLAGIIAARRETALANAPRHKHVARPARRVVLATAAEHVHVPAPMRSGALPLLASSCPRDRDLASGSVRTPARSLSPGAGPLERPARDVVARPALHRTASCRRCAGQHALRGPPLPSSAS
jgi:hypothetical protein